MDHKWQVVRGSSVAVLQCISLLITECFRSVYEDCLSDCLSSLSATVEQCFLYYIEVLKTISLTQGKVEELESNLPSVSKCIFVPGGCD